GDENNVALTGGNRFDEMKTSFCSSATMLSDLRYCGIDSSHLSLSQFNQPSALKIFGDVPMLGI
ncbi:MAG: hypothetical protein ACR2QF_05250, partial [Geminicoccaceae bacterium]